MSKILLAKITEQQETYTKVAEQLQLFNKKFYSIS
jgi:uncharacterized coiled-coil protein SlyX